MHQTLKKLGKPVQYLELAGQGHVYIGIDAQTRYYRAAIAAATRWPPRHRHERPPADGVGGEPVAWHRGHFTAMIAAVVWLGGVGAAFGVFVKPASETARRSARSRP